MNPLFILIVGIARHSHCIFLLHSKIYHRDAPPESGGGFFAFFHIFCHYFEPPQAALFHIFATILSRRWRRFFIFLPLL